MRRRIAWNGGAPKHPSLHFSYDAQRRALYLVQLRLKDGGLVRPSTCTACGAPCKPDGHHTDYRKPLDVTWLCRKCHQAEHRRLAVEAQA